MSRALPHSEDAERAVLAGILLDENQLPGLAGLVDAEDFYLARHVRIFEACAALRAKETAIDLRTLPAELERRGVAVDDYGGPAYLAGLDVDLPDLGRLHTYAGIVRELATRRRVIDAANKTILRARGGDGPVDVPDLLASHRAELDRLAAGLAVRGGLVPGATVMDDAIKAIDRKRAEVGSTTRVLGTPTGFRDLDAMTGGFEPGQLIVIAGRPGMGKSAFAEDIALYVARDLLECAAVFNLEMTNEEWGLRAISKLAEIPFGRLRVGLVNEGERRRRDAILKEAADIRLYLDDQANMRVSDMVASLSRFKARRYHPSLVIVDYLQLIEPDAKGAGNRTRNDDVSAVTRALKVAAKELGTTIVALSQLTRKLEDRQDKRPMLSDLRDSGSIEQDADVVLFLYRDHVYNKASNATDGELIVAKQRNGETGSLPLTWLPHFVKFRNPPAERPRDEQEDIPW